MTVYFCIAVSNAGITGPVGSVLGKRAATVDDEDEVVILEAPTEGNKRAKI
jgi:hypothetical protein